VILRLGVEEYPCDQESRKHEEQIDAQIASMQQLEEQAAG
jgi:hypothetical protein